jgi:hypothetical protein
MNAFILQIQINPWVSRQGQMDQVRVCRPGVIAPKRQYRVPHPSAAHGELLPTHANLQV